MDNRIKRLVLSLVGIVACVLAASAQTDPNLAQYYEVPSFYNPSATGTTDYIRIRGGYRMQWLGVDNAPRTFAAVAEMPVKLGNQRLGVGVRAMQESIGLYKTLDLGAQVSYKLRKWGGLWSVGLQLGFADQSFKGSEVYIPDGDDYHDSNDDAIPTQDIHGTAFDAAAGLWFEHPRFYAGLSCTHLTSPTITMNAESATGGSETSGDRQYQFQAKRTLYFTAGCNIPIKNTLFELAPSVLVKSDFGFTTGELTARARYRKMLSAGVGYRWDDAVVITLGAEIKNFYVGYGYEYATSAIRQASSGSHEVFVGYSLKLDLSDKNRHRHKSVRIM